MRDEDICALFAGLGPVTIRRMFGGKGIYHNGVIVALEVDGEILLKADALSAPDFRSAGSRQWVYADRPGRKATAMPYWTIPEDAIDDADRMTEWARKAYDASLRTRK